MHIITGILLSLLLKGKKSDSDSPLLAINWPIQTVHLLPGRVRFRIPLMKTRGEELNRACADIGKIKGVDEVDFNVISGSVLVHFDRKLVQADLIFTALIRLLGLENELNRTPRPKLNAEIQNLLDALNNAVYSKTNGILDLYTALPLTLAILGISKIVNERKLALPTGLTMIWWAYNSINSKRNSSD
jgi:hypothetical protein